MSPSNLSPAADRDINDLLMRSALQFGEQRALSLRAVLHGKCNEIAAGYDHGHRRTDVPDRLPLRFLTVPPFVIVYDPATRIVIRVLDGRRDFKAVFVI